MSAPVNDKHRELAVDYTARFNIGARLGFDSPSDREAFIAKARKFFAQAISDAESRGWEHGVRAAAGAISAPLVSMEIGHSSEHFASGKEAAKTDVLSLLAADSGAR